MPTIPAPSHPQALAREVLLGARAELLRYCGQQLRQARRAHHLSQRAFAAQAGISQSELSLIEQGKSRPGFLRLLRLSLLLGMEYGDLWPPRPAHALVLTTKADPCYQVMERLLAFPDAVEVAQLFLDFIEHLHGTQRCLRVVPLAPVPS